MTTGALRGNIMGGITAGIIAMPVALAFGIASGLGPMAGLYTAIGVSIMGSIFGGTKTQISGPTGPMTVVVALVVSNEIMYWGSVEAAMPMIMLTFLLAGLFQLLLGVLKLGKYIRYIPQPVISGFMSGIGVIIIILQLKDFFGIAGHYNVPDTLTHLNFFVAEANWQNVFLASITILIIVLFPRLTKMIPSTLVALVVVATGAWLWKPDVFYIGNIPDGLPIPDFSLFASLDIMGIGRIIFPAFSLAALGMIDSLLTSVVADQLTQTKHNSDRELVGQGIGNMTSALIGGIPGSGTTVCTVANIKSGGTGRLSGIIHGLFLIFIVVFAAPVAEQIPIAVLAGILITIGFDILDYSAIRKFAKIPKVDNIIMITVLILTVFWNLLYAVAIGLIMASLHFMKKMADIVELDSRDHKVDRLVDDLIHTFKDENRFRNAVYVTNLKGPLFFGFASRFRDSLERFPDVRVVIFNMGGVPYIDQSGVYTFIEALKLLHSRGINVCISELRDQNYNLLKGLDVFPDLVDENHVFPSVEECMMWLNEPGHLENKFARDDELYIPTAFTPNSDGINDEWIIRNIDKYPNCRMKVFTREGELLMESEGYQPWDGTIKGRNIPADRYIFELDLANGEVIEGTVSLFR